MNPLFRPCRRGPQPVRVACWVVLIVLTLTGTSLAQGPKALLQTADQLLEEIGRLRGLEIKSPVQKGVRSADEIRESLKQQIEEELGAKRVEGERMLLARLGVIPPDYPYLKGILDLLDEQVAGYYDPRTKTLFIASWLSGPQQKEALTHELVHALQDQHFDLKGLLEAVKDNDDAALARKALVEGEAMALTIDHALRPFRRDFLSLPNLKTFLGRLMSGNKETSPALQATPAFLRELFVFPYLHGVRFLQVYRRWHPWSDLEKVYADPPQSTEQILHPEKYAGRRDDPTPVDRLRLPASLPPGWAITYTSVFGEFATYLWLREFINEPGARAGSSGWDGDAVRLLRHTSGAWGLSMTSVWDDAQSARQFFRALGDLTKTRFPQAELAEDSPSHQLWLINGRQTRIQLSDVEVEFWDLDPVESSTNPTM